MISLPFHSTSVSACPTVLPVSVNRIEIIACHFFSHFVDQLYIWFEDNIKNKTIDYNFRISFSSTASDCITAYVMANMMLSLGRCCLRLETPWHLISRCSDRREMCIQVRVQRLCKLDMCSLDCQLYAAASPIMPWESVHRCFLNSHCRIVQLDCCQCAAK